jgi:hypothetical protein
LKKIKKARNKNAANESGGLLRSLPTITGSVLAVTLTLATLELLELVSLLSLHGFLNRSTNVFTHF